jgi:chromosome segregation protein
MKLVRLTLSGFKSFAVPVDLTFDEGVTAIVGPNGCGKSNMSDAVRWVLGEQRTRILRGQRMDDVIFHGSARRKPVSLAEVTLVFDNGDGTLPIAYHEAAITRRLSRSGLSDYLINQSSVRLRDVQDLLRGTGLGSEAGVVIEAGMIDRLLSDRTEERRSLFEEAAGIGLYRDRRTTTERRLEKTAEDLTRLEDLIAEVQTQVRSLARQRGKAERLRQFTDQRFAIVMTLMRHDLAALEREGAGLAEQRRALAARIPASQEALLAREQDREARVQARATAEARRAEVERRLTAAQLEVGRLDGDLKLAGERLDNAAARRARAQGEREQAREAAAQGKRERDAAKEERTAAEAARQSVQTELDLRSANEDAARQRLAAQRQAARELEEAVQARGATEKALQAEQAVVERETADLRALEADLAARLEQAQREASAARGSVEEARRALAAREREQHEATGKVDRARHEVAARREQEAALRVELRAAEEAEAQAAARRDALAELERERVGLAPAARQLLQHRGTFGDGAVLGPLSDFVRTSTAEARLAERLLADWLHAVLVRDEAAVEAVRRWHAENQPGPLVLLPVKPGPAVKGGRTLPAGVDAGEPAARWVAALIANDEVLDPDGRSIRRASGAVFLSTDGTGGGLLSRRAELTALEEEGERSKRRRDELEQAVAAAQRAHTEAESTLVAAAARAESTRLALHEAQALADDAERHLQRVERERAEAEEALARARRHLDERAQRRREIQSGRAAAEQERARLEGQLQSQRAQLADLESQQEAARERRVHWQVEEAQVQAREQAAHDRETRAAQALAQAEAAMGRLQAELAEIDRDTSGLDQQRARWTEELVERRVQVQRLQAAARQAEADLGAGEEALRTTEMAVEDARDQSLALREESHALELRESELQARRHAMVERVEGEWHKSIDELLRSAPEVPGEPEALRQDAGRLGEAIEALGPVNALAVEEHGEELKRLEFLTTQRDDLVHARDALLQAAREIDQTARTMFVETFQAIRQHFAAVFDTLFDGGECEVRLADDSDPLNSDIEIRAAPRGKRTQRIHLLSSGERTLVAISLLFAIYLTKPSPFCLLDEVDAPLDDANVARFVRLLSEFKAQTQFLVITHNPRTMQACDAVYGVTMQEPGVSTIVGVRLGEVETV